MLVVLSLRFARAKNARDFHWKFTFFLQGEEIMTKLSVAFILFAVVFLSLGCNSLVKQPVSEERVPLSKGTSFYVASLPTYSANAATSVTMQDEGTLTIASGSDVVFWQNSPCIFCAQTIALAPNTTIPVDTTNIKRKGAVTGKFSGKMDLRGNIYEGTVSNITEPASFNVPSDNYTEIIVAGQNGAKFQRSFGGPVIRGGSLMLLEGEAFLVKRKFN
jgi:hypothetical protein